MLFHTIHRHIPIPRIRAPRRLTYFKLEYDNQDQAFIYDTMRAERDFGNKNIEYHIEFFKSGFNAIVKMWLSNGCKESPEEMAEILKSEYRGR